MPEQEKRAKVIKDLEEVRRFIECENLPAHTLKAKLVIDDAIALLKAQEPQVLTVEAVRRLTRIPVWLDIKSTHKDLYRGWVLAYMVQKGMGITGERLGMTEPSGRMHWYKLDDYGRTWRCWTSHPTDEQREAVKWNG